MDSTALLAYFRTQIGDTAEPYLWSDAEIYQYMELAIRWFCSKTWGIADATTEEITVVECVAGQPFAAYDPRIIKLRAVMRAADGRQVNVLNVEDLGRTQVGDDYGLPRRQILDNRPGDIVAVVVGMQENMFRLINVPAADQDLQLIVYRYPLEPITDEGDQEIEIHERHHAHLVDGMMAFAYRKQDAETFDRTRADEAAGRFEEYCDQVRAERELREHKNRAVAYGGY
jgi:hypothetical protein